MSSASGIGRAAWHWQANAIVLLYLAASVVVAVLQGFGTSSRWLLVHVFLLGAVTNAIVIWSAHFATTLLRSRKRRDQATTFRRPTMRLIAINAAVVAILSGVSADQEWLTVAAAAVLCIAVGVHAAELLRAAWGANAGRFAVTVRFYWAAGVAVILGVTAGTALAVGVPAEWYARVFAAHVHLNLFGWVALTVLGTEFTFWPMVLRTRIASGVELAARQALPWCAGGLLLTVTGLLAANRPAAAAGLVGYLVGVVRSLEPFARTAVQRVPHTPAAWMLAAATGWLVVSLAADLASIVRSPDVSTLAGHIEDFVPWVLTGFVAQVLMGALTYLVPVVVGRGPTGGRRAAVILDRWGPARIVAFNAAVAMIALPLGSMATKIGWWLVVGALAAFVGLGGATLLLTRRSSVAPPVSTPVADAQP